MDHKEQLLLALSESDTLLSDTSVFTLLGVNNSIDKTWDKIPGKGYYLSALALFTVLGLYARIYFALKGKPTETISTAQEDALNEIKKLIKANKLEKFFVQKSLKSSPSSDEDFFYKFMNDLDTVGDINLGLEKADFRPVWKQIRNMLSHVSFSFHAIGGKHVSSEDEDAAKNKILNLPNYDIEYILEVLRANYPSTEVFTKKDGTFTLNTSVLLAYMKLIKDFLLKEIEQADEDKCESAMNSIKELVFRQQKV